MGSLTLFFFLFTTTVLSQWCSSEGCIPSSGCECPSFWTYCNTNDNVNGRCDLTTTGIFVIAALSMLILFFILIILCVCCCCCSNGLCRPRGDTAVHYHSHPFITTDSRMMNPMFNPSNLNQTVQMV